MGESTIGQIVFAGSENKSASELGGAMPVVVNAIPDSLGVVRRRPGIKAWPVFPANAGSGSPVVGMTAFGEFLVYVTADRKLHSLSSAGEVAELSDDTDLDTLLDGDSRPSLISGREMVVAAGHGAIQKWTGMGLSARLENIGQGSAWYAQHALPDAPGGPPPDATFLSAIAQRLVAQPSNGSGQIWWSGPLEAYENWDLANGGAAYIQASAKPDPIVAMADNTNEVFAFGSETIQVYAPASLHVDQNDPTNTLDFDLSRTMNLGTVSPYSIVSMDDMFAVLDRQRRFVVTDGRTYNDISRNISQVIRDMANVTDAWSFRMRFGRFDCLVWMFPTDGYGLIWDAQSSNWAEWRAWSEGSENVHITSAFNWSEQNAFLVGLDDGSIAQLDDAATTDLEHPIKVEIQSGFTTHGTMAQKASKTVMLQFKRTRDPLPAPTGGSLSASGHVRVSIRDTQGPWKVIRDVQLSDDRMPVLTIRSLGVYRTRQWKLEYTGQDELQLVSAQEEFEILGA